MTEDEIGLPVSRAAVARLLKPFDAVQRHVFVGQTITEKFEYLDFRVALGVLDDAWVHSCHRRPPFCANIMVDSGQIHSARCMRGERCRCSMVQGNFRPSTSQSEFPGTTTVGTERSAAIPARTPPAFSSKASVRRETTPKRML